MSIELEKSPAPAASAPGTAQQTQPKRQKTGRLPQKRTMNLYYKPDRTTKPATIALYTLFVLVCLLALSKFLVYDLWMETKAAQADLAVAEGQLSDVTRQLTDYNEVRERYQRYSSTDEERERIDRMEVLALLDEAVGTTAQINSISISGNAVQIHFSGVTLAQTAQIVRRLEASPIVASITVNTAATAGNGVPDDDSSALVNANAMIQLQKEVAE